MSRTRHPIWTEIADAKSAYQLREIILGLNERARPHEVEDVDELRDMARSYAHERNYPTESE